MYCVVVELERELISSIHQLSGLRAGGENRRNELEAWLVLLGKLHALLPASVARGRVAGDGSKERARLTVAAAWKRGKKVGGEWVGRKRGG